MTKPQFTLEPVEEFDLGDYERVVHKVHCDKLPEMNLVMRRTDPYGFVHFTASKTLPKLLDGTFTTWDMATKALKAYIDSLPEYKPMPPKITNPIVPDRKSA